MIMFLAVVLLAGPLAAGALAGTGFGTSATPTVQLSSQVPVAAMPGAPDHVYSVDGFALGQDVWVAVPSVANGRVLTGTKARVYVVPHRAPEAWIDGARLMDISGGFEVISINEGQAYENYLMIWASPGRVGQYDIVLDFPPAGVYNSDTDLIDHGGKTGLPGFNVLGAGSVDYLMITPDDGFMGHVCTRIFGVGAHPGGLPEGVEYFVATGWNNGPNGTPQGGGGDDINLGQVSATWSLGQFVDEHNDPVDTDTVAHVNPDNGVYVTRWATGEGPIYADFPGATQGEELVMTTAPTWVRD
jgi:hypothetical protein